MTEISDQKFSRAYEMASSTDLKFPPDIMLHFYAYYKRATEKDGFYTPRKDEDIRNGFKANALLQVKDLSKDEAREKYVEMVEKYIGEV
ncbi:acyl-CoA-binding protein [Antarcticibacterium sp. 1MA-6-2]|uniref:acyl-CoA-binding protein n=1 Tax=Antarcticibacterium sp. 1MA-6-2 TaxID=2908210 RepID=UPI001F32509B|nr:acyl-CoA-binding protein [Antarcticibacterium sp. 1MA-6-2]UJH91116.1 acyl-CoA-binding protein [Antarcticibacterium sp. 1MA-6-2]